MLTIDNDTALALKGSRDGDKLEVFAWYDGKLTTPEPLEISDWKLSWDGSDSMKVQGVLTLTVNDPDGKLSPWLWSDPLGVGGARLMCRYSVGGAGTFNRGWYRITGNKPKESWYSITVPDSSAPHVPGSSTPKGHKLVLASGGASVPVTAEDLTVIFTLDEFLFPEQPAGTTPTVQSEITRIVNNAFPLVFPASFVDGPVPLTTTYEGAKIDAIMDLAASVGASVRMGGNGEMEVYVKSKTSVWTVAGGDDGALINIDREQSADLLKNIGVVTGEQTYTDSAGKEAKRPIYGIAKITSGDLRVGGPLGSIPKKLNSSIMDTQAKVDAAAATLLSNTTKALSLDLEVTCLPNPALQIGDWITVTQPLVGQDLVPLQGEVIKMEIGSAGTTVGQMKLTVRCAYDQVQSVRKAFTNRG